MKKINLSKRYEVKLQCYVSTAGNTDKVGVILKKAAMSKARVYVTSFLR